MLIQPSFIKTVHGRCHIMRQKYSVTSHFCNRFTQNKSKMEDLLHPQAYLSDYPATRSAFCKMLQKAWRRAIQERQVSGLGRILLIGGCLMPPIFILLGVCGSNLNKV